MIVWSSRSVSTRYLIAYKATALPLGYGSKKIGGACRIRTGDMHLERVPSWTTRRTRRDGLEETPDKVEARRWAELR